MAARYWSLSWVLVRMQGYNTNMKQFSQNDWERNKGFLLKVAWMNPRRKVGTTDTFWKNSQSGCGHHAQEQMYRIRHVVDTDREGSIRLFDMPCLQRHPSNHDRVSESEVKVRSPTDCACLNVPSSIPSLLNQRMA